MSNLATIEKIESVSNVENSDFLHKYRVLGWQCVSKSIYNVGDLVVYIRIDTIVDSKNPVFSFLENKNWRVKTMKLRGEYSNGLILPWQDFFDTCPPIHTDVSNQIGIKKYDKPVSYSNGDVLGPFPSELVSKTDEENIQNIPDILNDMWGQDYYATIKADGSSVTYIHDNDGNFRVCSRTLELKDTKNSLYWHPVHKFNYNGKLPKGIIIQGEVCGPKIQNNPMGLKEVEFRMFNAFQLTDRRMFNYNEMVNLSRECGIPMVDIHSVGNFKYNSVDELVDIARSVKYDNGKKAEGLVFRLQKPKFSPLVNKNISFKVLNPEYK